MDNIMRMTQWAWLMLPVILSFVPHRHSGCGSDVVHHCSESILARASTPITWKRIHDHVPLISRNVYVRVHKSILHVENLDNGHAFCSRSLFHNHSTDHRCNKHWIWRFVCIYFHTYYVFSVPRPISLKINTNKSSESGRWRARTSV